MDFRRIEALLLHEGFGAVGRTLSFTTDAVNINVVADDVSDVDRNFLMRKGGEADAAAAIDHTNRIVDGTGRSRAFDNIVDTFATIKLFHRRNHIRLLADVHNVVGA